MASTDNTNPAPGFPRGDTEIHSLARRLRARATSVLHDAPEQRTDLLQAADLIDILVHYRVQLRWLADEIADARTAVHLRHLLEGGAQ
jgi:hypothetical protein